MNNDNYIGDTHQQLQVLSFFHRKGLSFNHDTRKLPEFTEKNIRYRPDFVIRNNPIVIVEIDENGHSSYDLNQEVKRLKIIWNAFNKKVMFLRVAVDKKRKLTKIELNKIYDKVISYSGMSLPIEYIIVDQLFYSKITINRYLAFLNTIIFKDFVLLSAKESKEDVEESKEDVEESKEDVEESKEDVEESKEDVEESKEHTKEYK